MTKLDMGFWLLRQPDHTEAGSGTPSCLLPTTAATTLRKTQDRPLVIDGPFAETKEQLAALTQADGQA